MGHLVSNNDHKIREIILKSATETIHPKKNLLEA
jgi:hypothetical protein